MRVMKINKGSRLFAIAAYAFAVICASILFYMFLSHITYFQQQFYRLMDLLSPFFVAILIAYLLSPVINFLEKRMIKLKPFASGKRRSPLRAITLIVTALAFLSLCAGFVYIVIPQIASSLYSLVGVLRTFISNLSASMDTSLMQYLDQLPLSSAQIEALMAPTDSLITMLTNFSQRAVPLLYSFLLSFSISLKNIVLGFIMAMYLLFSKEKFLAQAKKSTYAFFSRERGEKIIAFCEYINRAFGGFVFARLLDSFIIGVLCFIFMRILRLDYAVLISVIIGVTNVIPYFGPVIGAIPSALILLVESPAQAFVFIVFIILLQQFDGNILGPRLLGASLGLPSFWILFSVILCSGLFGVLGMFLGVPIFSVIYSVVKSYIELRLERQNMSVRTVDYEKYSSADE